MTYYAVIEVGCLECDERCRPVYLGTDRAAADRAFDEAKAGREEFDYFKQFHEYLVRDAERVQMLKWEPAEAHLPSSDR